MFRSSLIVLLLVSGCALEFEDDLASLEQPAILGPSDDRVDWPNASPRWRNLATLRTAAIAKAHTLRPERDDVDGAVGFYSTATHGDLIRACPEVRFREQPTRSRCSSTLIGDDLILTAAHCVMSGNGCDGAGCQVDDDYVAIFNYRMRADGTLAPILRDRDVYKVTLVNARWLRVRADGTVTDSESNGLGGANGRNSDYYVDVAILRTDRPVAAPYRAAALATSDVDASTSDITVVGYPNGLPVKVSPGALLSATNLHTGGGHPRGNDMFLHDADTMGGNSGGGTFNDDGELVGVFVAQDTLTDYRLDADRDCFVPAQYTAERHESMSIHVGQARSLLCPDVECDLDGGAPRACEGECRRGLEDVVGSGTTPVPSPPTGGGGGGGGGCNSLQGGLTYGLFVFPLLAPLGRRRRSRDQGAGPA